jgi:ribokinase
VGSTNVDLVLRTPSLPAPGDTVLASTMTRSGGGKGANQAVALARLGAEVTFISAVGADDDGRWSLADLMAENVDTTGVLVCNEATGLAVVTVDRVGENSIVVVPGANAFVTTPDPFPPVDVVLLSLEIPMATVVASAHAAKGIGAVVVLNAAPAQPLPAELLEDVDVLVVNENEWAAMADAPCRAVVTLGAAGADVHQNGTVVNVAAPMVSAVDTTGAGDCFAATLAFHLGARRDLLSATAQACAAAADSVTRLGARQGSARMTS